MIPLEQVKQSLESAGQAHVLQFWSELCEQEKDAFLQELSLLDLQGLREHCEGTTTAAVSPPANLDQHLEPIPPEFIGSVKKSDKSSLTEWENKGELHKQISRDYDNKQQL